MCFFACSVLIYLKLDKFHCFLLVPHSLRFRCPLRGLRIMKFTLVADEDSGHFYWGMVEIVGIFSDLFWVPLKLAFWLPSLKPKIAFSQKEHHLPFPSDLSGALAVSFREGNRKEFITIYFGSNLPSLDAGSSPPGFVLGLRDTELNLHLPLLLGRGTTSTVLQSEEICMSLYEVYTKLLLHIFWYFSAGFSGPWLVKSKN